MMDHTTNRSRGFGFISYVSEATVDKVLAMPNHIINGKAVECKKAVPRSLMRKTAGPFTPMHQPRGRGRGAYGGPDVAESPSPYGAFGAAYGLPPGYGAPYPAPGFPGPGYPVVGYGPAPSFSLPSPYGDPTGYGFAEPAYAWSAVDPSGQPISFASPMGFAPPFCTASFRRSTKLCYVWAGT